MRTRRFISCRRIRYRNYRTHGGVGVGPTACRARSTLDGQTFNNPTLASTTFWPGCIAATLFKKHCTVRSFKELGRNLRNLGTRNLGQTGCSPYFTGNQANVTVEKRGTSRLSPEFPVVSNRELL